VISNVIKESLENKYKRSDTNLVFNGVTPPFFTDRTDYIESLGLKSRKYVFALGRFVEEKGFDFLINAFNELKQNGYRLVIAGDGDHVVPYTIKLRKLAGMSNVVLPGFVKGDQLRQLFCHARLFVLPSFHEGLPIALLEALSYRLPVLVSDIPANKQVSLPEINYFITGDKKSLKDNITKMLKVDFTSVEYDLTPYDWDKIALQTDGVYKKLLGSKRK